MKRRSFFKTKILLILTLALMLVPATSLLVLEKGTNSYNRVIRLYDKVFGDIVYRKLLLPGINLVQLDLSPPPKTLPVFKIRLKKNLWEKLDKERAQGIRDNYYRGSMEHEGKLYPVNIRYRGDLKQHWKSAKKSWRVKMPKGQTFKNQRLLNFITPQGNNYFNDFLAYEMARSLNMLAPLSDFILLYVNKKMMGVMYMVEQVDRYFQIRNWKMEGSIYSLETFDPESAKKSWAGEIPWENNYKSGRESKEDEKIISRFVNTLRKPGVKLEEIKRILNIDSYVKWKAIQLIFRSEHMDVGHNHKVYHDPTDGKLHYVAWDIGTMNKEMEPFMITNPVDKVLFNFPEVNLQIQKTIYHIISELYPIDKLVQLIENKFNDIYPYIQRQTFKENELVAYSNKDFEAKKENLIKSFKTRYQEYKNIFENTYISNLNGKAHFEGTSPVKLTFSDGSSQNYFPFYELSKKDFSKAAIKNPWHIEHLIHKFSPSTLELNKGIVSATNLITGKEINIKKSSFTSSKVKPFIIEGKKEEEVINLVGTTTFRETVIYPKDTVLKISPGSTLLLDDGVSILSYGRIEAIGTQAMPIQVKRLNPSKPYGVLALQSSLKENLFRFVFFEGGKNATIDGVFYTGMLSIFNSNSKIEHCYFTNSLGDDAVNIKMGSSNISNNIFYKTGFDALDMDFAKGEIKDNLFLNSGNDGIDLGTATPLIKNNLIIASVDKGISLGEHSDTVIEGNWLETNNLGVATKDDSKPVIRGNVFKANKIAITAYRKKIMYNGSQPVVKNNCFLKNDSDFDFDIFSEIVSTGKCNDQAVSKTSFLSNILNGHPKESFIRGKL